MYLKLQGENFELLPERAFLWRKKSLLVFSDIHLGRAESLQSMSVLPRTSVHQADLDRMTDIIQKYCIHEVLVLGNWIHKQDYWTRELILNIQKFFELHKNINWTIVTSSQDSSTLDYLKPFPIRIFENRFQVGSITFTLPHEEVSDGQEDSEKFIIQGSLHPMIVIKEGPVELRLPCFVLNSKSLTLPSFGLFDDGREIQSEQNQKIYAVTQKEIFEVPRRSMIGPRH